MKQYKLIFRSASNITRIPDSNQVFGAICFAWKDLMGEDELQKYLDSLMSDSPLMIHSSMYYEGMLPLPKVSFYDQGNLNKVDDKNIRLQILSGLKQLKKAKYIEKSLLEQYPSVDELRQFFSNGHYVICGEYICKSENTTISVLADTITRNGINSLTNSTGEGSLFSMDVIHARNQLFEMYIQTDLPIETIRKLLGYFKNGLGSRKSIGFNQFELMSIETSDLKFDGTLSLSKTLYDDSIDLDVSSYELVSQIYKGDNRYVHGAVKGKYVYFKEGSLLFGEKKYIGGIDETIVNGKKIYQYGIAYRI